MQPSEPRCTIGKGLLEQSVLVTYIPAGRSEPEERRVWRRRYEDYDQLVQRAADESYDAGDEPIEVRNGFDGRAAWTNSRYGSLD